MPLSRHLSFAEQPPSGRSANESIYWAIHRPDYWGSIMDTLERWVTNAIALALWTWALLGVPIDRVLDAGGFTLNPALHGLFRVLLLLFLLYAVSMIIHRIWRRVRKEPPLVEPQEAEALFKRDDTNQDR